MAEPSRPGLAATTAGCRRLPVRRRRVASVAAFAITFALIAAVGLRQVSFVAPEAAGKAERGRPARAVAQSLPAIASGGNSNAAVSEADFARLRLARGANFYALTSQADLDAMLKMVSEAGRLLVVDYYAPWCRACQKLLSQLHKVALEDRFRNVFFASVDFEQSRELCRSKEVKKLPTLEIYRGDQLRQRWSGSSKKRLLERLDNELAELGEEKQDDSKFVARENPIEVPATVGLS